MLFGHVMLDVETLSHRHDAIVFQVGAYLFNRDNDECKRLDWFIDIDEQVRTLGLSVSSDTLAWWATKNAAVLSNLMTRYEATNDKSLATFRQEFVGMLNCHVHRDTQFWANGVSFDVPKVEKVFGGEFCKFWNIMDFRTMKNTFRSVSAPAVEGSKHDASYDAMVQALHLKAIWKHIDGLRARVTGP